MKFKFLFITLFIICIIKPSFAEDINLSFQKVPGQPYFESQELMIDGEEYNTVVLRLKSTESGTGRLFWANSYDPQFNQPKSIWFLIRSGEHNYYFNVSSQNPNWLGWVKKMLVMPEFESNNLEIVSAKSVSGNLFYNIASGWQEFWGPKGREVIGSTVHLIPSSAIFDKSINIYIYWIIGLFFIISIFFNLFKSLSKKHLALKSIIPIYNNAFKNTIISSLVLWVLLTLNSDYNYFNILKDNYHKYFGKTIEQKRAVAYGLEYYDFLMFAKEHLPKEPVKFGLLDWSGNDRLQVTLRTRTLLIPHYYIENAERDYPFLLVYHPDPSSVWREKYYTLFAKYKDKEYIMKRINHK